MATELYQETFEAPSECQISQENGNFIVKGEKGELQRNLFNPSISFKIEGNNITISAKDINKKNKKIINTYKAHIKNMFKGSTEGHIYKLKICSGHFPMTVSLKGDTFEIKNFIGEKVPRKIKVMEGTTVKIDGTEIIVESTYKEKAGQMAASIEQLTRRPGFDKRIFQDGIYIVDKDGKLMAK